MEAQWRDSLCSLLRAAEERFRRKRSHTAATLEVLDEPSPLALALAALKKARRAFAGCPITYSSRSENQRPCTLPR